MQFVNYIPCWFPLSDCVGLILINARKTQQNWRSYRDVLNVVYSVNGYYIDIIFSYRLHFIIVIIKFTVSKNLRGNVNSESQ